MPMRVMRHADFDHDEVEAIIQAARLRAEASRMWRAVQDAGFRLEAALDASRRAKAAVRDTLHLPPEDDDVVE
jgi:hypothetical protein